MDGVYRLNARKEWRDFILDPSRPGRHLASIGSAVDPTEVASIDADVLEDFLGKISAGPESIQIVASIIDLAGGPYAEFCSKHLPNLLDSLANKKIGELAVVGPRLRGNARWDLTAMGRISGRLSPVQFISRLPERSFSLPENALVRWLIDDLARAVNWIESKVGSRSMLSQLLKIRDGCEEAFRHHWFQEVQPPRWPDVTMRIAAERQRLPAYRLAANLTKRRLRFQNHDRAARVASMLELLSVNWLSPVSDDDLFELYALVFILDLLKEEVGLGEPVTYGLNSAGRGAIAEFKTSTGIVRVFFDQSPVSTVGSQSYQLNILAAHEGVRGVARRPDITVVHDHGAGRNIVLVEVKRTIETGYISDSVYKALGYLSDFREIWVKHPGNPKIVLFFPEDIRPKSVSAIHEQEVVLASSFDRDVLSASLRSGLLL